MIEIIMLAFSVALNLYLWTSFTVYVYALLVSRDLDKHPIFDLPLLGDTFFAIGAFFMTVFLLQGGFEQALFFIPDGWGSYDAYMEEWDSTKETLSGSLAIVTAFIVACYISKTRKNAC